MTVYTIDDGPGPHVHALVIGVGAYQNCGRGVPRSAPKEARSLLGELDTPLTCAPLSAAHVADWLLTADWDKSDAKLGTVDVLLSSDSDAVWPTDPGLVVPRRAVYNNVRAAWRRWVDVCDTDDRNIALLYFCGHGWGGAQTYLLVEDFAAVVDEWENHVIDFNQTRLDMRACRALTQYFFLDTCSNEPYDLGRRKIRPHNLIVPDQHKTDLRMAHPDTWPNNPVLKPTPNRIESRVQPDEITPFARALVKTFDGLGARERDDAWEIRSRYLVSQMSDVLDWYWPDLHASDYLDPWRGESNRDTLLRRCPGIPLVPFRLGCTPDSIRSSAHWELRCHRTGERHRYGPDRWEAETLASAYDIKVDCRDGIHREEIRTGIPIEPAGRSVTIRVERLASESEGQVS
ncbi:hypothetical protein [Kitasatospora sp. NPDC059571]|uniref:hypothetical protein n=1 Tax=Kitasatospora sp. NPDC059571 TaxID=3346871 RepID=UPI0036CE5011